MAGSPQPGQGKGATAVAALRGDGPRAPLDMTTEKWGMGGELEGRRVRVLWPKEDKWFEGVLCWKAATRDYTVAYDDGDHEHGCLLPDPTILLVGGYQKSQTAGKTPATPSKRGGAGGGAISSGGGASASAATYV